MSSSKPVPFYLFIVLVILSPIAIDIYLPAIPVISESLNASLPSVQATVAIFLAAMGLGQIIAGPIADKFGRRPLAISGIALYFFGSIIASFASYIELLWLARVLQGFGACAVSVSAMSGIRDSYGPERSSAMYSYVNGVICVIPSVAPLLGGFLTEFGGWRSNFYFMVATSLLFGLLIAVKLPETRPADTQKVDKLISWTRYKFVLANPIFRFHTGLVMLSMAIIIGFVSLSPAVLMVAMKQSPFAFALWFGSNALLNMTIAFIAPRFVRIVGKKVGLITAITACLVGAVSIFLAQDISHPLAFMAPIYIAGIGFCLVFAICGGAAIKPFGEQAGTASALMGLFQMSGAALIVGLLQFLPISGFEMLAILMSLPFIWVAAASQQKNSSEIILSTLK